MQALYEDLLPVFLALRILHIRILHVRILMLIDGTGNDDTGEGGMPSLDEITEMCHQALDTGMELAEEGRISEGALLALGNHLQQVMQDAQNLGPEAPATPTYGNEDDADEEVIDEGTLP